MGVSLVGNNTKVAKEQDLAEHLDRKTIKCRKRTDMVRAEMKL